MGTWKTDPEWNDLSGVNYGNEYQNRDGVRTTDINKMVENMIYLFNHMPLEPTVKLDTPSISILGNILTIEEVNDAEWYDIYADGYYRTSVHSLASPTVTYDCTNLILTVGTHTLRVKARAVGYKNSDFSNGVSYSITPLPYIVFRSQTSFYVDSSYRPWTGTMEYSKDGITWSTITGSGSWSYQAQRNGDVYELYFRGTNNSKVAGIYSDGTGDNRYRYCWNISGTNVECIGNIETLIDYQTVVNGEHFNNLTTYCLAGLFYKATALITAPDIDLGVLSANCCYAMFYGCTGLLNAPKIISATALASNCYQSMFSGCTHLTSVEEGMLPATALEPNCYYQMFYGCSALTNVPRLPATITSSQCYYQMFYGCTSLRSVPNDLLPATLVASGCYSNMFNGCTSLTNVPRLPATLVASSCYSNMFRGCTSLTTLPADLLPATDIATNNATYCYSSMFNGCTSLTNTPELPSTTVTEYCYSSMFRDCTSLVTARPIRVTSITAQYCCQNMFNGCTSLVTPPAMNITRNAGYYACAYMFQECTSLTSIPRINATIGASDCFYCMFKGCSSLKVSTTQSSEYAYEFTLQGYSTSSSYGYSYVYAEMFAETGGEYTGSPGSTTTTYYTTNPIVEPTA